MSQVTESIEVLVPVSVAYNQWTQFESFPEFLSYVESVTQVDDTRNHWVVNVDGVKREFDTVITEQEPDRKISWERTEGEVNHAGVVTFNDLSGVSSRVTVQLDWDPQGLLEKAGAALGIDDHSVKKDLEKFKAFIEYNGDDPDGWRGTIH